MYLVTDLDRANMGFVSARVACKNWVVPILAADNPSPLWYDIVEFKHFTGIKLLWFSPRGFFINVSQFIHDKNFRL